jgi:ribosomal protein L27
MIRHKFRAKACEYEGIKFPSLKERKRYIELKLLQRSGEVVTFLRQTAFHLPGDVKYVCDYTIFWTDGTVTFEDVKGQRLPMFIAKKKMVEDLYYPITITEV